MNNRRWFPVTEYALLLGSGAGAVVSLATQNAVAASLPVTALVALGLFNRRRVDQALKLAHANLDTLEEKVGQEVSGLAEQVSALPTPEAIMSFQRAAMIHSDRAATRFSQVVEQTQQEFEKRIEQIESPDLSHLYQDTAQLQDQYTYVCTTLSNLSKQIERLSTLHRIEATETEVSCLKTELMQVRVSLETLNGESRAAQATLQDAVRHLDRRLRQVPTSADPYLLKGEVRELIKAVADLVPRREFSTLAEKLQIVQDAQVSLRQTLDRLQTSEQLAHQNGHVRPQNPEFKVLETELVHLSKGLQQVEMRLEDISVPFDITAEIRGTTATYLSSFQWQLALLEQKTQELMQQQQELKPTQTAVGFNGLSAMPAQGQALPAHAPLQWLMAFRGDNTGEQWSTIDQALFEALDEVSERLVLVWPWSSSMALDRQLIERFSEILERGCRLEIGWCHPGDRREGLLLKRIAQQWGLTTAQRQLLKSTLNQLLPLKERYPHQFSFKILGTDEQFLVCDRTYAIVGLQALPAASSTFPALDLRVKTTEITVIDQLLRRFDNPDSLPEDATACFNRAITRYDLRDTAGAIADFSRVLEMTPDDAIAANNRGIVWAEKKQFLKALEDFSYALELDPQLFSARCNRGWLLMTQGYPEQAIIDFDLAIQAEPTTAIPYFYRGTARQKQGDNVAAIADYTQAIQHNEQVALPYCYRGATYQRQGNATAAITDLEMAASLLHAQGDHRSLAQVTQVLSSLKRVELTQPLRLHSV
ncbi:MAG: tetratricopeptide repeat protein [Leptolyngbya sp. SIO1E4]|nr:tetratricopeptide repeat protein [Leptolyngbya sp. SIO1E4]